MVREQDYFGGNDSLAAQVIIDLTEANLPAGTGDAEWAEELAFLRGSTGQERIVHPDVDEVLDLSTLLA